MKKTFYHILFFLIIFLFPHHAYSVATIEGTVTDSVTGLPIAGALVQLIRGSQVRYSDITDINGMYSIDNIEPANYTIVISAAGYQTRSFGVKPPNNQITVVNVTLIPNGGSISGTVISAGTLLPIPGANVLIFQRTLLITSTTTNGAGAYSVSDLAPGNYIVLVLAAGFDGAFKGAIVESGLITIVDFALDSPPGSIAGTVTDAVTTNPIEGALVEVYDNDVLIGFADTDVNGDYLITSITPGDYSVVASEEDVYQTQTIGAHVEAGLTTIVDFALNPNPGTIEGIVINASNGAPIPGAIIVVFQEFTPIASVLTDQNGRYSIPVFTAGNYIVIADAQNFAIAASGAIVILNTTATENFALEPDPGIISGTVIDASTTDPIAGAIVGVFDGPVLIAFAVTDPNGNYQIPNLEPNTYTVVGGAPSYQTQTAPATVLSNTTTTINFALVANPGSIAGTITDAFTTDPIPNATVAVFQGRTFISSILTDVNGDYIISNLAPGNYIVVVRAAGYQSAFSFEIVVSNVTTIADFALNIPPGAIAGNITDACLGNGVQGALILVTDGEVITGFGLSDMNGVYSIEDLAPGTYLVAVRKKNFINANSFAEVIADEITTLNFILIPLALPPTNVTQSFIRNCYLTQTDFVPVISWSASPSSCVTGYYIFRDGKRFAFIPASSRLRYIDCAMCEKSSIYSVQAINSFGQVSSLVAIS